MISTGENDDVIGAEIEIIAEAEAEIENNNENQEYIDTNNIEIENNKSYKI